MVDILLAVYNGEKYLKEQLNSIINQTYQDFNIIIRDDGSTDDSFDIIKEFTLLYPEKIKIVEGKPSGSAKNNFFELMNHTNSDYIMFCDQDDVWLKNKIELTLSKMKEFENTHGKHTPLLCHTDLKVVDENLNTIHPSFYKMQKFNISKTSLNYAMVQNIVTGCTIMINKPLLDIAKGTNSENIIMHDWWLFLIASAFGKVEAINTPTMLYRQHENNQLGAAPEGKVIYYLKKLLFSNKNHSKNILLKTCMQAKIFNNTFSEKLSQQNKLLAKEYSCILQKNKLCKIITVIKFRFWKHSFIRKLGQIFMI